MENEIALYKKAVEAEAGNILDWWEKYMPDKQADGFYGSIDRYGNINAEAPRGLVMYSRILWAFSAGFIHFHKQDYLVMSQRAYDYLLQHFYDNEWGGLYWSVDACGNVIEEKKQVYGIAFGIYGLSEFYRATENEKALLLAIELFEKIEKENAFVDGGGYIEAFGRKWEPLQDLRLSEKDENEKKSMNTHLHILEAYTALYRSWKNEKLAKAIRSLLNLFEWYIIDGSAFTQRLFFSEDWQAKSAIVSYGHDIEASWLLYEAAEVLEENELLLHWKTIVLQMAAASVQGIDVADGGMWYEKEGEKLVSEKHWWPQAEAMVGYLSAYQLSANENYLELSVKSFAFIQKYLIDKKKGEWYWGIDKNYHLLEKEKAGFWKCPYHNVRACLEVNRRLHTIAVLSVK